MRNRRGTCFWMRLDASGRQIVAQWIPAGVLLRVFRNCSWTTPQARTSAMGRRASPPGTAGRPAWSSPAFARLPRLARIDDGGGSGRAGVHVASQGGHRVAQHVQHLGRGRAVAIRAVGVPRRRTPSRRRCPARSPLDVHQFTLGCVPLPLPRCRRRTRPGSTMSTCPSCPAPALPRFHIASRRARPTAALARRGSRCPNTPSRKFEVEPARQIGPSTIANDTHMCVVWMTPPSLLGTGHAWPASRR